MPGLSDCLWRRRGPDSVDPDFCPEPPLFGAFGYAQGEQNGHALPPLPPVRHRLRQDVRGQRDLSAGDGGEKGVAGRCVDRVCTTCLRARESP